MTKATLICDLQYGSTGKGLIAGYMANKYGFPAVICANMPNAGHSYVDEQGRKTIFKVLPVGAVSDSVQAVMLGPGAVFNIEVLQKEIEWLNSVRTTDFRILIHRNATVLDKLKHSIIEGELIGDIGSTRQGTLGAIIDKLTRGDIKPTALAHKDQLNELEKVTVLQTFQWRSVLDKIPRILVEGAQGFSLGINEQFYPFCTSRDCSPGQILVDCGIPIDFLGVVIGSARTFPIRVGGNSGPWYGDQRELSWDDFPGVDPERTTVTNRIRRVATFSYAQIEEAMWQCRPDYIFLNFLNYFETQQEAEIMFHKIEEIGKRIADGVGLIKFMGFGPSHADVEERIFEEEPQPDKPGPKLQIITGGRKK